MVDGGCSTCRPIPGFRSVGRRLCVGPVCLFGERRGLGSFPQVSSSYPAAGSHQRTTAWIGSAEYKRRSSGRFHTVILLLLPQLHYSNMLCGTTNQTTLRRRLDFQIHQRALQSLGPFVLVWFCDAFWGRRRVQTGPIERVGNSSQDRPHVSAVRAPASAEPLYAANEVGTLERRIQRRISDGIRAKALVELLRSECLLFDMIISKLTKRRWKPLGSHPMRSMHCFSTMMRGRISG